VQVVIPTTPVVVELVDFAAQLLQLAVADH
jgi:hypothetical protein